MGLGQASIETHYRRAEVKRRRQSVRWCFVEALERTSAVVLLLLFLPGLLTVAALITLLSRRTPFIAHLRVGQEGKAFWVLKFRTMWGDSPAQDTLPSRVMVEHVMTQALPTKKRKHDPRVANGFAAFCRKYSIDELPQLWHVIRGEMALVGPRPLTPEELATYYHSAATEILQMRPGLTGLWQVRGRSRLSYRQRLRFDLFMVRNWSIRLHAGILLATIPRVLLGKDAW